MSYLYISQALADKLYDKLEICSNIVAKGASGDRPFFLGATLSLVDISLAPFLDRFEAALPYYRGYDLFPPSRPRLSSLAEMLAACRTRPAFNETSQTPQFYIAAYRAYASRRGASRSELSAKRSRLWLRFLFWHMPIIGGPGKKPGKFPGP